MVGTTATEILDATEESKPTRKRLHAIVQQRVISLLVKELGLDVALPELALAVLDAEGKQIVPDVVVVDRQARFENGVLTSGAYLAVEIMSPRQSFAVMADKYERLLASGIVSVCWLLWPENSSAYSFMLTDGLRQKTTAIGFASETRNVVLSLIDVLGNLPTEA